MVAQRPFATHSLLPLALAAGVTVGIVALLRSSPSTWLSMRPATCLSTHCFCEHVRLTVPRQPASAWSSVAYVLGGLILLTDPVRRRLRIRNSLPVKCIALLSVLIGCGSFFYGSTLTFLGQFFDIFGMYLLGTFILAHALVRRRVLQSRTATVLYVAANVLLAVVQYNYPDARRYLFALLLVPGILLEFLPGTSGLPVGRRRPLIGGFALLVVGYALWLLDQNLVLCSPGSALQGHAVWHVLTATSVVCLAAHYSQTESTLVSSRGLAAA